VSKSTNRALFDLTEKLDGLVHRLCRAILIRSTRGGTNSHMIRRTLR
jgi:hypothetical protein